MNILQFEDYLKIYTASFNQVDLLTLNHYIERFMYTVPFENISVQNKETISVNIDDLFNKIVHRHRGGFCYELNTIFQYYLKEKGFNVDRVSGTIHTPDDNWSRDGSHMSTIVHLDQPYIADVGFGDLPTKAIPISEQDNIQVIHDVNGHYRAILDEDSVIHLQKQLDDQSWRTSYLTNEICRPWDFFIEHLDYNVHHPDSIFVQKLIITMAKEYGRVSMSYDHLTITSKNHKQKESFKRDQYKTILEKYFGIDETIHTLES